VAGALRLPPTPLALRLKKE